MSAPEPMVMCPVCREAWPDRLYWKHAQTHQPARPAPKWPEENEG